MNSKHTNERTMTERQPQTSFPMTERHASPRRRRRRRSGPCYSLLLITFSLLTRGQCFSEAPSIAPSLAACEDVSPLCESWCATHPSPWPTKCAWESSCGACPDCATCKPWCDSHPSPWTSSDDTNHAKCDWINTCDGYEVALQISDSNTYLINRTHV